MIVNSFSALDAFFCLLRMALAVGAVGMAAGALAATGGKGTSLAADHAARVENRGYLLFQTSIVLLVLCVASWPLLYAVLQSYVSQWPGVMCIYGVMRVGAHSQGASSLLPTILQILQIAKPAIVFAGGAWFVLYLAHRQSASHALLRPMFVVLACFGLLAAADAALEGAYLVIPKTGQGLDSGCCTTTSTSAPQAARFLRSGSDAGWVSWAFFGHSGGMVAALVTIVAGWRSRRRGAALAAMLLGAAVSLPLGLLFLTETLAPAVLGLPFHHCPYDLAPRAPESLLGIAAYILGAFCIGWAAVAYWLARKTGGDFTGMLCARLLFLAAFGYAAAFTVLGIELAVAA